MALAQTIVRPATGHVENSKAWAPLVHETSNHVLPAAGDALVRRALARRVLGPNRIKAAIAACQVLPDQSDWPPIRFLYETLLRHEPTDDVRLNLTVAIAEAGDMGRVYWVLASVAGALQDYQAFWAACAALHEKARMKADAVAACTRPIDLATSSKGAAFLRNRPSLLLI